VKNCWYVGFQLLVNSNIWGLTTGTIILFRTKGKITGTKEFKRKVSVFGSVLEQMIDTQLEKVIYIFDKLG